MTLPIYPVLPGLTYTVVKAPGFNTLDQAAPNAYEVRIQQAINPVWSFTLVYDFLRDFFWGSYTSVSELRTLMGFFLQMGGKAGSFLLLDPDDNYVGPALSTGAWVRLTRFPLGFGILDSANHWQKVTAITTGVTGASLPSFNHAGGTTADAGITWTDQGAYSASGFPNAPLALLPIVSDGAGSFYSPIQRTFDGTFYEDVTDLAGAISVYVNGSLATAGTGAGQYQVAGPGLALPNASYMGMYLKWGAAAAAWTPLTPYSLGNRILDSAGHIQQVTTAGTSGSSSPIFDDAGGTTNDPSFVIWTDKGSAAWASATAYSLGAAIIDPAGHAQVCTTAGTSGSIIPTFNHAGGTTPDGTGSLIWTDKGNAAWVASTAYPLGAYLVVAGHAQEATPQGGISGSTAPAFSTSGGTAKDPAGSVVWTDQGAYAGPAGPVTAQFNFYFRVRFDSDSQDFEKFCGVGSNTAQTLSGQGGGFWTIGGSESKNGSGTLRLVSARPTPL